MNNLDRIGRLQRLRLTPMPRDRGDALAVLKARALRSESNSQRKALFRTLELLRDGRIVRAVALNTRRTPRPEQGE